MAYLDGTFELVRPARGHVRVKSYLRMLVEAYALERGIDLTPYGGWTLKNAPRESGAEPDECYIIGTDQQKDRPDLVIDVIWTSGGIDKLEIYRRLEVGEVWFWKDGRLSVQVLRDGRYVMVDRSVIFPGLDLELVSALLDRPTAMQAVRALRETLRPA